MICLIFFNPFVESDNIFLKKSNYVLRIFPFRVVHTVNMMKKRFIFCGLLGWCLEIFWTGLHSLFTGNFTMMGKTSLLMFPVYGLAALIRPAYCKLKGFPVMVRGIFYSCGIFFVEFLIGSFFQKLHICPWDYSHVPLQYKGVIRLDYAPLWFLTGLFFEWLLRQNPRKVS